MRSVTVEEILRRATKKSDQTNSSFFSLQDKIDLANEAYTALYDILVTAYENYYVADPVEFTISSSTDTYPLPDDFYKLIGVDWKLANNEYITLRNFNEIERNSTITTRTIPTGTVRLRYVPAPQVISSISDTIDGVSGWDALLVTDIAIAMMTAEESDTRALERKRQEQLSRIIPAAADRDISMPATISDIYMVTPYNFYDSVRYRLYGQNLVFRSTDYLGVSMGGFP